MVLQITSFLVASYVSVKTCDMKHISLGDINCSIVFVKVFYRIDFSKFSYCFLLVD